MTGRSFITDDDSEIEYYSDVDGNYDSYTSGDDEEGDKEIDDEEGEEGDEEEEEYGEDYSDGDG